MEKKTDRRTVRSRDAIQEACLQLMEESGFERLTVQLIADRADVNRTTLYAHYSDKYDLVDRMIDAKLEALVATIKPAFLNADYLAYREEEPHPALVLLFEFVSAHERFFRLMFGEKGVPGFKERMMRVVGEQLYGEMLSLYVNEAKAQVSPDVLVGYLLSAHMGVITAWLSGGMRLPPREIARQLNVICYHGPFRAGGVIV